MKSKKLTRRLFLTGSIVGAGLFVLNPFNFFSEDRYGFLERKIDLPKLSLEEIMHTLVPLHEEERIDSLSQEHSDFRAEMEPKIIEGLEKGELGNRRNNYKIELTRQRYGVPEEPEFVQQLLKYCRTAEQFLYAHLPKLERFHINWTVIKRGDNYSKKEDFNGKGLIGKALYEVIRYRGINADTKNQDFIMVKSEGFIQSFLNMDVTDDSLKYWNLFIGSGPNALAAPFSEIIPLSLYRQLYKYREIMGVDGSRNAMEAVSEGISHLISLEIVKELSIPHGRKIVEDSTNNLVGSIYRDVPDAIKWMERNGIQRGLELYMADPIKFMDAIKA